MLVKSNLLARAIMLSGAFFLSSCASTGFDESQPDDMPDFSSLYLRGVFTWWEADEAFKVEQMDDHLFRVPAKLIADGEPYDFKFADANWTPGLSCGKAEYEGADLMKLDSSVNADCVYGQENFKFVPEESGTYYFYIDFSNYQEPEVYITR